MPHSESRFRHYRMPGFVLSAALLVAVGLAMVLGIRRFTLSAAWVEHTCKVMATTEGLRSAARSAESAGRGYRLTGRPTLLAEYLSMVPHVQDQVAALTELTADNPCQQQRVQRLQGQLEVRLRELQRLNDLQQRRGIQAAGLASARSPGERQMRAINALTDDILAHERTLLRQRHDATTRQAGWMTAGVIAGIALPLVLLGVLLSGQARENRRSRSLERDARNALAELADALEQRGRLSEQRRVLGACGSLLQSCETLGEAMELTAQVIAQLLPHVGGRCHVLRASQNLADTVTRFGTEVIASDAILQPVSCWSLRRGAAHRSGSGAGNIYCAHLHPETLPDGGWTLCVPLAAQGTALGLLHLNWATGGGDEDVALVEAIAEQLSLAMVNLQLRETLRVQSLRDPLTGLYNRRYLEESLQRELLRCERRGKSLSVVMLDVDHFKRCNDQHGHAAGDALLARIGHTLESLTRNEDVACRYGGEEFTLVLPEADRETALRRAEEIRQAIGATSVVHLRETLGPNTASLGVATFPDDARTPAELLQLADAALYRAKAAGRDRVALHGVAA